MIAFRESGKDGISIHLTKTLLLTKRENNNFHFCEQNKQTLLLASPILFLVRGHRTTCYNPYTKLQSPARIK